MSNIGKIITIIIIVIVGAISLTILKETNGGGMGFFGLFGVAIYLVYQNLFKKKSSVNNNETEKRADNEIKLKK